jgi:hypothetical protein
VLQTGACILPNERPLPAELRRFLEAGLRPIYFGLGSMHAPSDLGRTMVEAARALGRRAIVSTGWPELSLADDLPDCIQVAETNHQALFRTSRVSCTTAAPAPPPSPPAPALPRSRSRSSTTSTTGLSESSYLGAEVHIHARRRPGQRPSATARHRAAHAPLTLHVGGRNRGARSPVVNEDEAQAIKHEPWRKPRRDPRQQGDGMTTLEPNSASEQGRA